MSLLEGLLLSPAPYHVWVSLRTDSKGSGTITDPYKATTAVEFDELMTSLMSSVRAGLVIHLGPGEFLTQGYYDGASSGYG